MTGTTADPAPPGPRGVFLVALVTALAWFILLGDDPASWIIGVPAVALSAWLSRSMPAMQGPRVSMAGALRLAPYFVRSSLVGGWDVARRVVGPRLAVNPGYVDFRLTLPQGASRTFFVQFIGLLPGTLAAWEEGDNLKVHVLELDLDHERELRLAEERVAALFGAGPGS